MKRPVIIVTFALAALLSPNIYGGARRSHVSPASSAVSSIDAEEYQKVYVLGKQAAEVAAKVGVAQLTITNDKLKKAYQKKAAKECIRGTADALENLDVDTLLQDLGWLQRKYVEVKVGEIVEKLRGKAHDLSVSPVNTKRLAPALQWVLGESRKFGEHAINQAVGVALNLGVIADEQKRKEFGKCFASKFTAGVEDALRSLDIKAIAKQQSVTLADNQVELVKNDMHKHIKRMRETIESGALGEFLATEE